MHIFIDENIPQGPEVFSAYGEVTTFPGRTLTREHLDEADVLLVRSITPVNAAQVASLKSGRISWSAR